MALEMYESADLQELTDDGKKRLKKLFYTCNVRLGGTSLPIHLEEPDYMVAFEQALQKYRTMSSRSINQTFGFLTLNPGQSHYYLHERIDVVKRITRRGYSTGMFTNGVFDSNTGGWISSSLTNSASGDTLDLTTIDFAAQYNETVSKIMAYEINFGFRNEDHMLTIYKIPRREEQVLLEVSVLKTIDELLKDHWSNDWLQKYTLAVSKTILGEKYSYATNLPGPQGGTILKGEQLKTAGENEMLSLEDDILVWADSSDIALPIMG